jgi:transcriptional regulator with XRE-family HTH domain
LNGEHEKSMYRSEITNTRGQVLFCLIFKLLCQRAGITQDELADKGKVYRDYQFVKGYIKPWYKLSALDQGAISRVLSGDRSPSYDQVETWLDILEKEFNSDEYKEKSIEKNLPIYEFPSELKTDLFHLAGFPAPDEMMDAYEKRLHMATEPPPRVSIRDTPPRGRHKYTKRENSNMEVDISPIPQEEI